MEWIEPGIPTSGFWKDFAEKLSVMHRHTNPQFGYRINNYIGSLPQVNSWTHNWFDFFRTYRLEPQIKLAIDTGKYIPEKVKKGMTSIMKKLEEIIPQEKPSLIHGDLWSGNYMVDEKGTPVLIDPAIYYGHRESDLAMMKLFGGFPDECFFSYHEFFPLEPGWKERLSIYNLYPLWVHVNLFGESYLSSIESIIHKFA
jgi:fructosamine-3-kinase